MNFDLVFDKKKGFYAFEQRDWVSSIKKSAISIALAIGLVSGFSDLGCLGPANAAAIAPALPDVSVLISGPPIKDPGALLRYALPIDNKAIREVQKPLEDITESLKVAGVKALDSVERVRKPCSLSDIISVVSLCLRVFSA